MANSISNILIMSQEYQNYKNSLSVAGQSLNNVVSQGTILYNDPNFASQFPTQWAAYQTYLVNLGNLINTFLASVPSEPPLTS